MTRFTKIGTHPFWVTDVPGSRHDTIYQNREPLFWATDAPGNLQSFRDWSRPVKTNSKVTAGVWAQNLP